MNDIITELHAELDGETDRGVALSDPALLQLMVDSIGDLDPEESNSTVVSIDGTADGADLREIDDAIIKAKLDEILMLLVGVRDGACGKDLMQDLRHLFGTDPSPGTVYPHLNELAEEGVFEVRELRWRKVYELADAETTFEEVETTIDRMLVFAIVLKWFTASADQLTDRLTSTSKEQ